ncbi:MAG: hypothetical protein ACR2OU_15245 [Thermomicrobiales bacterium]
MSENNILSTRSSPPRDHADLRQRLVDAVIGDERLVGLVDYGSSSEGRADRWSDVDCSIFVQPSTLEEFRSSWTTWIAQFGTVLLSFVGDIGNHWSVIDGESFPIRVDFNFYAATEEAYAAMEAWPNAPLHVESILLVDKAGALRPHVEAMVGRDLGPLDMPERVDMVAAGFWYYAVRTWCKLQRGPSWGVRFDISFIMFGNLMALLRLEAGKIDRWRAADAAAGIEDDISVERLAALNACIPDATPESLSRSLAAIIRLGAEATSGAAARYQRKWP